MQMAIAFSLPAVFVFQSVKVSHIDRSCGVTVMSFSTADKQRSEAERNYVLKSIYAWTMNVGS